MVKSATFSEDRKRRFDLVRDWREEIGAPDKTMLVAGLNPSKAGEKDDDPTVRKTVGFGRRWGFGRVVLVNLNPIVSTDPWKLPAWSGLDMQNRAITQAWVEMADLIVAAWGTQPRALSRKIALPELVYEFRQNVGERLLYCIGTTSQGYPKHPSRAPYTNFPAVWSGEPLDGSAGLEA